MNHALENWQKYSKQYHNDEECSMYITFFDL